MEITEPVATHEVGIEQRNRLRALVKRATLGEADAREALYRWFFPALHRLLAVTLGADSQLAPDLCADAFIKAFKELPHLKDPDAFWPWLKRIAQHRLIDHHRSAARQRKAVDHLASTNLEEKNIEAERSPDEQFDHEDDRTRLMRALAGLEPDHQEVLRLRFVEDLTLAQVGEYLGRTPKAAESLLARARDAIRKAWNQTDQE